MLVCMRKRAQVVILSSVLSVACGNVSGGGQDSGQHALDAAARVRQDAPLDASAAGSESILVLTNVALSGSPESFPQAMDIYLPPRAARVVVFLHGGGGTKEGGASREIGVRLDEPPAAKPVPDTAWLLEKRTAFVFPQGQALATAPKATTWSNYVMSSGVDDLAFLKALASALRAGTLHQAVPAFSRLYLAGHSNGGMMAARTWCEAAATFDGYASLSGPASVQLALAADGGGADKLTGAHACQPQSPRPYIAVIGGADSIVQTADWNAATWSINPCLTQGTGGSIIDANLLNEEQFHHKVRVPAVCGDQPSAPVTAADGRTTTWSDCSGRVRLERVTHADHCVVAGLSPCVGGRALGNCTHSLDAESGLRIRDVVVDFFSETER
jgi:polyhydroxybutyrate depolymerase